MEGKAKELSVPMEGLTVSDSSSMNQNVDDVQNGAASVVSPAPKRTNTIKDTSQVGLRKFPGCLLSNDTKINDGEEIVILILNNVKRVTWAESFMYGKSQKFISSLYSTYFKPDGPLNNFIIPKELTFTKSISKAKVLLDKHVIHNHSLISLFFEFYNCSIFNFIDINIH